LREKDFKVPKHIAVIMDGNGRWARKRMMPRIYGHREGVKRVKEIVRACGEMGVEYLTLFTFSRENWKRPEKEVKELMQLLSKLLREEEKELMENNVRFKMIGRLEELPLDVVSGVKHLEDVTSHNTGLTLVLAINYGGRAEIIDAVKKIKKKDEVTEENFKKFLYFPELPEPDLLIRTGGELRISNFLLWEIAYTELYFTKTLWPDFTKKELIKAIKDYSKRERRFGSVNE